MIFISYRHDDSFAYAGRIADGLAKVVGLKNVFFYDETNAPGVDFVATIEARAAAAEVMLVVIGPNWRPDRLRDPKDFVRRELELGRKHGAYVIPVLVHGAALPQAAKLPESLRWLTTLHAHVMHDTSWARDYQALEEQVRRELARRRTERRWKLLRPILLWAFRLTLTAAVVAGLWVGGRALLQRTPPSAVKPAIVPTTSSGSPPPPAVPSTQPAVVKNEPAAPRSNNVTGTAPPAAGVTLTHVEPAPVIAPANLPVNPPVDEPPTHPIGIDLSHFSAFDWEAPAVQNFGFAFARATQGRTSSDAKFRANFDQMKQHHLIRGAYHFWLGNADGALEAQHFLDVVKPEPGDLLAADVEEFANRTATDAELRLRLHAFLKTVAEATRATPIIYTSKSFWESHMDSTFSEYPLWLAGLKDAPTPFAGWTKVSFWQYKQDLPGAGNIDVNTFNGTFSELRKLAVPPAR